MRVLRLPHLTHPHTPAQTTHKSFFIFLLAHRHPHQQCTCVFLPTLRTRTNNAHVFFYSSCTPTHPHKQGICFIRTPSHKSLSYFLPTDTHTNSAYVFLLLILHTHTPAQTTHTFFPTTSCTPPQNNTSFSYLILHTHTSRNAPSPLPPPLFIHSYTAQTTLMIGLYLGCAAHPRSAQSTHIFFSPHLAYPRTRSNKSA